MCRPYVQNTAISWEIDVLPFGEIWHDVEWMQLDLLDTGGLDRLGRSLIHGRRRRAVKKPSMRYATQLWFCQGGAVDPRPHSNTTVIPEKNLRPR